MNRYRVSLLGASFSIESDQDDATMAALQGRLESAIALARSQTGTADPLKLAILGGLILADELASCRDALEAASPSPLGAPAGMEEAERIALKLISDLEDRLGG